MDHHAYLYLGEREGCRASILETLRKSGFEARGNPDLHLLEGESFTVVMAREVGNLALGKAFGEYHVILLNFERFTPEAQNALLKTLEDPPKQTHFFVVGRQASDFLATVRSRMQIVEIKNVVEKSDEAQKFFKLSLTKRIDFAKKFALNQERSALSPFLDCLLLVLRVEGRSESVKRVWAMRTFGSDPSSSPRMILEHLALVL